MFAEVFGSPLDIVQRVPLVPSGNRSDSRVGVQLSGRGGSRPAAGTRLFIHERASRESRTFTYRYPVAIGQPYSITPPGRFTVDCPTHGMR